MRLNLIAHIDRIFAKGLITFGLLIAGILHSGLAEATVNHTLTPPSSTSVLQGGELTPITSYITNSSSASVSITIIRYITHDTAGIEATLGTETVTVAANGSTTITSTLTCPASLSLGTHNYLVEGADATTGERLFSQAFTFEVVDVLPTIDPVTHILLAPSSGLVEAGGTWGPISATTTNNTSAPISITVSRYITDMSMNIEVTQGSGTMVIGPNETIAMDVNMSVPSSLSVGLHYHLVEGYNTKTGEALFTNILLLEVVSTATLAYPAGMTVLYEDTGSYSLGANNYLDLTAYWNMGYQVTWVRFEITGVSYTSIPDREWFWVMLKSNHSGYNAVETGALSWYSDSYADTLVTQVWDASNNLVEYGHENRPQFYWDANNTYTVTVFNAYDDGAGWFLPGANIHMDVINFASGAVHGVFNNYMPNAISSVNYFGIGNGVISGYPGVSSMTIKNIIIAGGNL